MILSTFSIFCTPFAFSSSITWTYRFMCILPHRTLYFHINLYFYLAFYKFFKFPTPYNRFLNRQIQLVLNKHFFQIAEVPFQIELLLRPIRNQPLHWSRLSIYINSINCIRCVLPYRKIISKYFGQTKSTLKTMIAS